MKYNVIVYGGEGRKSPHNIIEAQFFSYIILNFFFDAGIKFRLQIFWAEERSD